MCASGQGPEGVGLEEDSEQERGAEGEKAVCGGELCIRRLPGICSWPGSEG